MANHTHIPKVAVITRTKDRGILLERAIKSVHQQSMSDFVHVIINDSGNPGVVDSLVEKHKDIIKGRVKVIHNRESHGMEAASNKAIKSVDSEFIAIHDDDDTWHPNFLKETTERLATTDAKGAIVLVEKIDESIIGDSVQEYHREPWKPLFLPELRTLKLYDLCLDNFAVPISFIYRREVFDKIGYYDEQFLVCGDWEFTLRFMRKYDIEFLNDVRVLAFYHHRPKAKGINGNSIFANNDLHEKYGTMLANKLLRMDLESGGLGLGYLFNARKEHSAELAQQSEAFKVRQELLERMDGLEQTILVRTDYRGKVIRFSKKLPVARNIRGIGRRAVRKIIR